MRRAYNFKDLSGIRFGRLVVVSFEERIGKVVWWKCICDCGIVKVARGYTLRSGDTQSCGCLQKERTSLASKTHGMSDSQFASKWSGMKTRVLNKKEKGYRHYGGRGISIEERWLKFENFKEDMYQEYVEHVNKFGANNTTLERKDVDSGYSKDNCRWATWDEQRRNRTDTKLITYKGKTLPQVEWSKVLGLSHVTLRMRLHRGWSIEKAFTTPIVSNRTQNLS